MIRFPARSSVWLCAGLICLIASLTPSVLSAPALYEPRLRGDQAVSLKDSGRLSAGRTEAEPFPFEKTRENNSTTGQATRRPNEGLIDGVKEGVGNGPTRGRKQTRYDRYARSLAKTASSRHRLRCQQLDRRDAASVKYTYKFVTDSNSATKGPHNALSNANANDLFALSADQLRAIFYFGQCHESESAVDAAQKVDPGALRDPRRFGDLSIFDNVKEYLEAENLERQRTAERLGRFVWLNYERRAFSAPEMDPRDGSWTSAEWTREPMMVLDNVPMLHLLGLKDSVKFTAIWMEVSTLFKEALSSGKLTYPRYKAYFRIDTQDKSETTNTSTNTDARAYAFEGRSGEEEEIENANERLVVDIVRKYFDQKNSSEVKAAEALNEVHSALMKLRIFEHPDSKISAQVKNALKIISSHPTHSSLFAYGDGISFFEFVIRGLGGLISGAELTSEPIFLYLAHEAGARMAYNFFDCYTGSNVAEYLNHGVSLRSSSASASGLSSLLCLPARDINWRAWQKSLEGDVSLRDSEAHERRRRQTSLAVAATNAIEFSALADLTGVCIFKNVTMRVLEALTLRAFKDLQMPLLSTYVAGAQSGNAEDLQFHGSYTVGAEVDSALEYIVKILSLPVVTPQITLAAERIGQNILNLYRQIPGKRLLRADKLRGLLAASSSPDFDFQTNAFQGSLSLAGVFAGDTASPEPSEKLFEVSAVPSEPFVATYSFSSHNFSPRRQLSSHERSNEEEDGTPEERPLTQNVPPWKDFSPADTPLHTAEPNLHKIPSDGDSPPTAKAVDSDVGERENGPTGAVDDRSGRLRRLRDDEIIEEVDDSRDSNPSKLLVEGSSQETSSGRHDDGSHLSCFSSGMLILLQNHFLSKESKTSATTTKTTNTTSSDMSSDVRLAGELAQAAALLTDSCAATYLSSVSGLGSENGGLYSRQTSPALLRPEVLEGVTYLYHDTQNIKYRNIAWKMLLATMANARVSFGLCSQPDADTVEGNDRSRNRARPCRQDTWVLAETLEYYLLVFANSPLLPESSLSSSPIRSRFMQSAQRATGALFAERDVKGFKGSNLRKRMKATQSASMRDLWDALHFGNPDAKPFEWAPQPENDLWSVHTGPIPFQARFEVESSFCSGETRSIDMRKHEPYQNPLTQFGVLSTEAHPFLKIEDSMCPNHVAYYSSLEK